jgi:hypothetical protein
VRRTSGAARAAPDLESVHPPDFVIELGKADLSFRHHPNLAGLPLSVMTLGIYLFVGALVWTHEQYFEIPVRVVRPATGASFEFVSRTQRDHWLGLYSAWRDWMQKTGACHGQAAYRAINALVAELAQNLSTRTTHAPPAAAIAASPARAATRSTNSGDRSR